MVEPRRGEIWWVRLDPTLGSEIAKTRPCIVISGSVFNKMRRTVVVVPLSSAPLPSPPVTVPVHCEGRAVVAVVDQIRAASKQRFHECIGILQPDEMTVVEQAVRDVLELTGME